MVPVNKIPTKIGFVFLQKAIATLWLLRHKRRTKYYRLRLVVFTLQKTHHLLVFAAKIIASLRRIRKTKFCL